MPKKKSKKRIEKGSISHLRKTHRNLDILLPIFALLIFIFFLIEFFK